MAYKHEEEMIRTTRNSHEVERRFHLQRWLNRYATPLNYEPLSLKLPERLTFLPWREIVPAASRHRKFQIGRNAHRCTPFRHIRTDIIGL